MKTKFTLGLVLVLSAFISQAQSVSNGGFETWTGTPSHPTGWCDAESLSGLQFGLLTKDQTANGHVEGASAVKLKTDSVTTPFGTILLNGFISYGTGTFNSGAADPADALDYDGAAFAFRPDSIKFSYKYTPAGNDKGEAAVYLIKAGADVGGNSFVLSSTAGNWMNTTKKIDYATSATPDTLFLFFNASDADSAKKNSLLWVDDVKFIYIQQPSALHEISSSVEVTVGPNPATVLLQLFADKNLIGHTIQVFDVQGKAVLVSTLEKNQLDISSLPNGNYFFQLKSYDAKLSSGRFMVAK